MPRHSPVRPGRARTGAPAAWLPAQSPRPGRDSPGRADPSSARPCGPPAAGRGVPAEPRSRPKGSRPVKLADLDGAAVFDVRMGEREPDRFVVVGGLDQVKAAEYFFGLAVRSIGSARLPAIGPDHAAGIFSQSLAVQRKGFFRPGHVFLDGLLHLLGAEIPPPRGIIIEQ